MGCIVQCTPKNTFEAEVQEEGNGWLMRHLGNNIPEINRARQSVEVYHTSISTRKTRLQEELDKLTAPDAQNFVKNKIEQLNQQEAKLNLVVAQLEEITYSYLLMKYAKNVLPTCIEEGELKHIIEESNRQLQQAEEIEREINAIQ